MSGQHAHCATVGHAGPPCPSGEAEGCLRLSVQEIDSRTPMEPLRLFDCHVHRDTLLHKRGLRTWADLLEEQQRREMSHNSVDFVIYSCNFPRHWIPRLLRTYCKQRRCTSLSACIPMWYQKVSDVRAWMSVYPRSHFGLGQKSPTAEVLSTIPLDRMLLESDAPYQCKTPSELVSEPVVPGERPSKLACAANFSKRQTVLLGVRK